MALKVTYKKHVLEFKFEAGTSRGVLQDKKTWYIKLIDNANEEIYGIGEAGPLVKLSIDDIPEFEDVLSSVCARLNGIAKPGSEGQVYELLDEIVAHGYPSIYFGLETAMLDLMNGGNRMIYNNDFYNSGKVIPINGLIWMGHLEDMLLQVTDKVDEGYNCIKIKIGSLNFERECDVLQYIRSKYYKHNLVLRVDANGAFQPEEAMNKLDELAKFNLHSIEQPIKPGNHHAMRELCQESKVPIALDEELIGIGGYDEKAKLLETILPQYIILKPTLVGGLRSCKEWIALAEQMNIGWWMTSALESNIGLNAIAQFTAEYGNEMHQGLGTGKLYHNNVPSPLTISEGEIHYDASKFWDLNYTV